MTDTLILREVACDSIRIIDRHRRDMGDLEALAVSIATEGLLQPIITDENVLVFGERRLLAVRDILKHATIAARVVQGSSIVAGGYAENEIRKDFTPSERAAIGEAVAQQISGRQGQRTDRELPRNCAEVEPGVETRAIAARMAGFGSKDTYERAKKVVEHAVDEILAQAAATAREMQNV
jgi:ParB family chromosome partitioning protein